MLLDIALADAYGAGFEFNESAYKANKNNLSDYVRHMGHPGLLPGMYTDDTQMSIAIAELMLERKSWNPTRIADKFVSCFKRDPRKGYASRFQHFLQQVNDGKEFVKNIRPNSDKSGSSMRSAVLGLYSDIEEVYQKTTMQAKLTHDTPDGIASALVVAFTSYFFNHNVDDKVQLENWLIAQISNHWHYPWGEWEGKVGVKGVECVRAALTAIKRNTSKSALLIDCVSFTGDVDTVAAIALGCVAHSEQFTNDLPQHLIDNLENKTYGKDYLITLDNKLNCQL
jgi:ADP-ribosylglycohydrolase